MQIKIILQYLLYYKQYCYVFVCVSPTATSSPRIQGNYKKVAYAFTTPLLLETIFSTAFSRIGKYCYTLVVYYPSAILLPLLTRSIFSSRSLNSCGKPRLISCLEYTGIFLSCNCYSIMFPFYTPLLICDIPQNDRKCKIHFIE